MRALQYTRRLTSAQNNTATSCYGQQAVPSCSDQSPVRKGHHDGQGVNLHNAETAANPGHSETKPNSQRSRKRELSFSGTLFGWAVLVRKPSKEQITGRVPAGVQGGLCSEQCRAEGVKVYAGVFLNYTWWACALWVIFLVECVQKRRTCAVQGPVLHESLG